MFFLKVRTPAGGAKFRKEHSGFFLLKWAVGLWLHSPTIARKNGENARKTANTWSIKMLNPILSLFPDGIKYQKAFFSVNCSTYLTGSIAANAAPTTYSATAGIIAIDNAVARTDTTNKNVLVIPDYIKMTCVTGTTNGDSFKVVWETDIINRWSSGGTSLTTLAANQYVDTSSSFTRVTAAAQIHFGDLTLASASSASALGQTLFRSSQGAIPAMAGDEYMISFGGVHSGIDGAITLSPVRGVWVLPTCILGPGTSLIGHPVIQSATASTCDFMVECSWIEVKHDFNA